MEVTLGIDLASQPAKTAVCVLVWSESDVDVLVLWRGRDSAGRALDDSLLIDLMTGNAPGVPAPSKVAIDAPLGWPVDFVSAVSDLPAWPVQIDRPRARLERRATDHWVHEITGKQPLSVTTDRIAYTAMRAAGLVAHYARDNDAPVDRSGISGLVCEAYPNPAIRRLGLWPETAGARDSYKGTATAIRADIVDRLADAAPWLSLSDSHESLCVQFDDCLDALICALVARATARGMTVAPPEHLAAQAVVEGWIHLPEAGCLPALH